MCLKEERTAVSKYIFDCDYVLSVETYTVGCSLENLFHLGSPCSSSLTSDKALLGSC